MGRFGFVHQVIGCTWMLIVALAGPARATEPDYAETGPYLGVGAAFAWDNFDYLSRYDPDMAYGIDAWGGYRFLSFLAAELQVEYLNGFDGHYEINLLPPGPIPGPPLPGSRVRIDVEGEAVTFTGNLKAYLPLGRFQPFVLAGVGQGHVELDYGWREFSETAFAARFGGGIDIYATDKLAIQLSSSYVLQTGDLDGLDYVSMIAGLQYSF